MLSLLEAKQYLRIDGEADDAQILDFLEVAEDYLRNAITDFDAKCDGVYGFEARAKMVEKVMVAELYDNRDQAAKDSDKDFSFTVRSMISQMQYTPTPATTTA